MAVGIKIHRGNQIGGCITEIWTERTRVLIDFGEELLGGRNPERLKMAWEAFDDGTVKKPAVSAVFFTHYHGDHIGRFTEVPKEVQLYMSELSRDVLANIHKYLAENLPWLAERKKQGGCQEEAARLLEEAAKHKAALDVLEETNIPQGKKRVHTFRPHERMTINIDELGDICVTPFWVDHSAGDACMFLIEAEDKRILHTGDFRGHGLHGRDGDVMCNELRRLAEQKQIDILITEGTMMSRRGEKPYSEGELLKTAKRFFQDRDHRHVFLIISSTNLDSLSTFYQAAKENHIPMYCHNPYAEGQIETLGRYAHERWGMPDMRDVERVKPWSTEQQERMKREGFVAIIKANAMNEALVQRFRDCDPVIVYSMWQGYVWRKLDPALRNFLERCAADGLRIVPPNTLDKNAGPNPRMHTSGHADAELIADVVNAAAPGELFPIHTEDALEFLRLDIPEKLKEDLQDRMIREGEAGGYSQKEDHRHLSAAALKKFQLQPKGTHRIFVELVKKYPKELAFCFRGNSGDAAVIYYKNHAVFHITKSGNVKFNFDHARYMDDWMDQRDWLVSKGFSFKNKERPKKKERRLRSGKPSVSYSIGEVSLPAQKAAALAFGELEKIYFRLRAIINSFFAANAKENAAYDQFRAECSEQADKRSTDRELTEKVVQQQLFLACNDLTDGYFFYDLEFSQPYGKLLGCKNQPDMLAIRFDVNGKPERLVLVEVKSRPQSMRGASGLKEHIRGMENYPKRLLPVRGRDAYHILDQYIQLGLMEKPDRPFVRAEFENLPKEILLIFTGSAVGALTAASKEEQVLEAFLETEHYQQIKEKIPPISLNGKNAEPMKVYRKEIG